MAYTFDLKNPLLPREIRVGDVVGMEQLPGGKELVLKGGPGSADYVAAFEILRRYRGMEFKVRRISDGLITDATLKEVQFFPAYPIKEPVS